MKIAIDAMGGDFAPQEIVKGAVLAVKDYSEVTVVLVGDCDQIQEELNRCGMPQHERIEVRHASQVIEMGEHPSIALRKKKDASVLVATRLVKEKECAAVIAPGSTGAAVVAALFGLGRIKGVDRPAIATPIPTPHGHTVMLDSGANANSKPYHLVQNAIMGYHYAKARFGLENPTVGLLNIGEEASKGNDLVQATYPILQQMKHIPFYGNVEGRDIPKGTVDVVVCDGFVGNVVLKLAEGVVTQLVAYVKEGIMQSGITAKLGAYLLKPVLKGIARKMDHTEHGGAPLLGVNGIFLIAHGSSKAKEISTAVRIARELAECNIVEAIERSIEEEGVKTDGDME